jgi:FkbM family methyltransferase
MKLWRALNKPYYVFRPTQLARRLLRTIREPSPTGWETVRLPWGSDIDIRPSEAIGSSIARTGVFELTVSETIWRLLDRGELAVDVGANVGYMTSLMAARVGPSGRVLAFEPHPELFRRLTDNARGWAQAPATGQIAAHNLALSNRIGTSSLYTKADFDLNMGTATMQEPEGSSAGRSTSALPVELIRLDILLGESERVGVLKVDVEGHELSVFLGASELLSDGRIRDILFEAHEPLPTPASELLESYGYRLYGLDQRFAGVSLSSSASNRSFPLWDAPTYLATNQPARALDLMARRGWAVLRSRP